VDKYNYDPDGRRVYSKDLLNLTMTERVYVYGLGSELMATYILKASGNSVYAVLESHRGYFGSSRLTEQGTNNSGVYAVTAVTPNRLGSVGKNYPYGENGGTGGIFATYTRDSGGLDYAMHRYYYSTTGRFVTPDPSGLSAVNLKNTASWNMYAYVGNDPVNNNDPTGLDDEGPPQTTCFVNGLWWPSTFCDTAFGFQRPLVQTAFDRAVGRLSAAQQAFKDRSNFSRNCQSDIAAIAAAAPSYIDRAGITIEALQAAATVFVNGVGSTVSQSALYPNSPQAPAVVANQAIGALFADPKKLTTAVTTLGGSTIYINPSAISQSLVANEGLLAHELLHELGLTDDAIGAGLHSVDPSIKPDANGNWTNTKQFSTKLAKHCFTGKDNRH
jgi:RHS repeat-associated protein